MAKKLSKCKRGHDTTSPDSRYSTGTCKACVYEKISSPEKLAYAKAYGNTPQRQAYKAAWRSSPEGRDYMENYNEAYNASPEGKANLRRAYLKRVNWTPEMYDQTAKEQGGRCMLCRQLPVGKGTNGGAAVLSADHDHETQEPRALLCNSCNTALGLLRDNPELCDAAAEYLRAWGK